METMKLPKKPAVMAYIRKCKGFSLVEMAIVLVIIGIIIGAIIKGQDLIVNSRAKQAVSAVTTWRNLAVAYLDRNGRLPGDFDNSGIIGDSAADRTAGQTSIDEIVGVMTNAPDNPLVIGSLSFWVYFGNVAGAVGQRSVIVICKDAACANVFTTDELEIIQAIDTAIDGSADAGVGQFRAFTAAPTITAALAAASNRANRVVSAAVAQSTAVAGSTASWAVTHRGALWAFDRPW
ncbi:MAG: prepilin-type N-terminal cleavage/methylation domain-containing protein [Desulfuromonadales bacterium]